MISMFACRVLLQQRQCDNRVAEINCVAARCSGPASGITNHTAHAHHGWIMHMAGLLIKDMATLPAPVQVLATHIATHDHVFWAFR